MSSSQIRVTGVYRKITFAALGLLAGFFVARDWNPLPLGPRTFVIPAPYRLAKIPGGTPLRMAMVHDIIHERYLRHGAAWYTQRNAIARKIIAAGSASSRPAPSQEYLNAMDDLAIGLERTGQYSESIAVLRQKLDLVSPLPNPPATRPVYDVNHDFDFDLIDRHDLEKIIAAQDLSPFQQDQYTTFANLGTLLVHSSMSKALTHDSDARANAVAGLGLIERAIALNPGAHFGREKWQAIAIESLLADIDHPDLLKKYDLIGDELDGFSSYGGRWPHTYAHQMPDITDLRMTPTQRLSIRAGIDRLGIGRDWAAQVNPDYWEPMPFDEPTLAIIGMWTLGGGPNAHFALTLGRIMETMAEPSIAWNAYERAIELQDGFWPDPDVRAEMVSICRARQESIAELEAPSNPTAWQNKMRAQHVKELAWGLAYQKAYQDFEAAQIAAGVALSDPNFYAPFFRNRPSIASNPGSADDVIVTRMEAATPMDYLPCLVLGIGIGMAIARIIPERTLS